MRGSDLATIEALQQARSRGIVPRSLVTITATSLVDGEPELFCFWDGVLPVDIEVVSGATGALEQRAFVADDALLKVSPIRVTSDLTIRPASFALNPLHPRVATMLANYSVRLAPVEIHRVPLDADSRLLVAAPRCRFLGFVETVKRRRPSAGSKGELTLNCISETVQLTRINPAKRSDESQKLRSGDRMMRYAEVAAEWDIPWGELEGKAG